MSALYDNSNLYENNLFSYEGWVLVQASGSGLGNSNSSRVRTTFSSGVAAGESGETSTWLRTVPKTASGSGGATAGDTATYLRTVLRSPIGLGVGTSHAYGATSQLREASSSGLGTSETVSFAVLFRLADNSTSGSTDVALWVNRGQPIRGKIILQPHWFDSKPKYIPR